MTDLVAVLRQTVWRCTGCEIVTDDPHLRWNYEGVWCNTCWHPPPPEQESEWYQVSDVIRFLQGGDP